MIFKILQILSYVALIQLIVLIINLVMSKGNKFGRFILIALFVTFGTFLAGNLILLTKGVVVYKIFHLINLVVFLSAPLLYNYFLIRLENKSGFVLKDILHFLPFIIIFAVITPLLINSTRKTLPFNNYGPIIMGLLFIQNVFYLIIVLKKLREKKNNPHSVPHKFYNIQATSNSFNFEINRIHKLFTLFFVIIIAKTGLMLACRLFSLMTICALFTGSFFLLTFLLINNIILFGLSKSSIFDDRPKYQSRILNEELKEDYIQRLDKAMFTDKMYLDPLLTLERLSKSLRIPRNYLSQLINEHFALNFNEMINQFRINDAKEIMNSKKQHLTIIDIAYQVGFNSKSTFNTAFKRYTGKTPSTFLISSSN